MKRKSLNRYELLVLFFKSSFKNLCSSSSFCLCFFILISNLAATDYDQTIDTNLTISSSQYNLLGSKVKIADGVYISNIVANGKGLYLDSSNTLLDNYGVIETSAYNSKAIYNEETATVTNYGTIKVTNGSSTGITNLKGTVINSNNATLSILGDNSSAIYNVEGTVQNDGKINVTVTSDKLSNSIDTIIVRDVINTDSSASNQYDVSGVSDNIYSGARGVFQRETAGAFINNGEINVTGLTFTSDDNSTAENSRDVVIKELIDTGNEYGTIILTGIEVAGDNQTLTNAGQIDINAYDAIGIKITGDNSGVINNGTINADEDNSIGIQGDGAQNSGTINIKLKDTVGIQGNGAQNAGTINVTAQILTPSDVIAIGVIGDNFINLTGGEINLNGHYGVGIQGDNATLETGSTIELSLHGNNNIGIYGNGTQNYGTMRIAGTESIGIQGDDAVLGTESIFYIHGTSSIGVKGNGAQNSGTIKIYGTEAIGIQGDDAVLETESIIGVYKANATGVQGDGVQNNGLIDIGGTEVVGIQGDGAQNNGIIDIGGTESVGIQGDGAQNSGTINVDEIEAAGIQGDDARNNGTINIFGDNSIGFSGGSIQNDETINITGISGIGISTTNGTIVNNKLISISADSVRGIWSENSNLVNSSMGTINAVGDNVIAVDLNKNDSLDNYGSIKVINENNNIANDTYAVKVNDNSTLLNYGEISNYNNNEALGDYKTYAVHANENSTVINKLGGTITAFGRNSRGIYAKNNSTIENCGTITATGCDSYGIFADESTTINNYGTITANCVNSEGVRLEDKSTLNNYGTIVAEHSGLAVELHNKESIVNLHDGSNLVGDIIYDSAINTMSADNNLGVKVNILDGAIMHGMPKSINEINVSEGGIWDVREYIPANLSRAQSSRLMLSSTSLPTPDVNSVNLNGGVMSMANPLVTNNFTMTSGNLYVNNDNPLTVNNSLTISGGTVFASITNQNTGVIITNNGGSLSNLTLRPTLGKAVNAKKKIAAIIINPTTDSLVLSNVKVVTENPAYSLTLGEDGFLTVSTAPDYVPNNVLGQTMLMQKGFVDHIQYNLHYYMVNNIESMTSGKYALIDNPQRDKTGLAFWSQGLNYYTNRGSNGGIAGYNTATTGVLAGMDQQINNGLIGIYGGWGYNNARFKGHNYNRDALNQDLIQFGLYGYYDFQPVFVTMTTNFNYGFNTYTSYTGLQNEQRVSSDFDSLGVGGNLMMAYRQQFTYIDIIPEIGINYQWMQGQELKLDAGDDIFDLRYKTTNKNFIDGIFGLRLAKSYQLGNDWVISPNIAAHWVQAFNKNNIGTSYDLGDNSGTTYDRSAAWYVRSEIGARVTWRKNLSFNIAYRGDYNSTYNSNGFFANLNYTAKDPMAIFNKISEFFE
ncbi:autotransporter domain-containing protein [Lentisphaerota bacterium WC36G]|nr:autotransporter domain-containing protein [Lentisphaerae bacterium WC36]